MIIFLLILQLLVFWLFLSFFTYDYFAEDIKTANKIPFWIRMAILFSPLTVAYAILLCIYVVIFKGRIISHKTLKRKC